MPEIQKKAKYYTILMIEVEKLAYQKRFFLFMLMETDFLSMHFDPVLRTSSSAVTKTFVCCYSL